MWPVFGPKSVVCPSFVAKVLFYTFGVTMRPQLSTYSTTITLKPGTQLKDLGIMITSELSWTSHCNMITSRAYKQLGLICSIFTANCISAKNSFLFL